MDIDTAIKELHAVMKYTRQGTFEDAVGQASQLLRLPRYRKPDDEPYTLLASDIKTAIARLPPPVRRDANALLPIDQPGSYLDARWRAIGASKYSGPAREWRWSSVLGRVAVELLALQQSVPMEETRSVRILSLDIAALPYLEEAPDIRLLVMNWEFESNVSDLRWFAFPFSTRNLVLKEWSAQFDDPLDSSAPDLTVARIPAIASSDADTYWYVSLLRKPPRVGVPVRLTATMWCGLTDTSPPWIEYTPSIPIERLTLSVSGLARGTGYTVSDHEADTDRVASERSAYPEPPDARVIYEPPAPQEGHIYRLSWTLAPRPSPSH
jgi:hypothetical protein